MAKGNWPKLILAAVLAFALGLALARAFQVAILASAPPPTSEGAQGDVVQTDRQETPSQPAGIRAGDRAADAQPASRDTSASSGKALFQQACATCHGIGSGDRIGPDLAGISARRERAWLIRAITVPDRLRLERDPITVELYDKFNRVDMPNLGLSEADAGDLIAYIDAATQVKLDAK